MHRLFFYLLILFLPTQFGLHFWPEWAMVLGRRVDYLSPTLYVTDILLLLTIGFWGLSVLLNNEGGNPKSKIQNKYLFFGLSLFIFLNVYFSINRAVAVYHWIKVAEFGLLGWYIVKTKPRLSLITYFLSLSVFYSSVIAIIQFLLQHSIGGPFWLLGERTFTVDTPGIARVIIGGKEFLRAYATFPHPNVLGGFLAVTLPFIANQLTNSQINKLTKQYNNITIQQFATAIERIRKPFVMFTILLGLIALTLTFSRSAWVVFALGMVFPAWSKKKNIFWIPAFAGMTLLLLFFVPLSFAHESVVVRQELNAAAVNIIRSAPLLGAGLGNFLVALPDHIPSRTIYFLQPVHNIYLLLMSEIGLIGVIGVIGVIRGTLTRKKTGFSRITFHLSLFTFLILGLVDHYPLTLQQGRLLLTVLLALSYRALR